MRARPRLRGFIVASALLCSGCATVPCDPIEAALYTDLRKAVELSEASGWVLDRAQLQNNSEAVMRSVCQVDVEARARLETWIEAQIVKAGGPAELRYRKTHDFGSISRSLSLERTRLFLRDGMARAAGECPFFLEPDPHFGGHQTDAGRFVVFAETIGFGSLVFRDKTEIGGGGGGRLLLGHGIGRQTTLAIGGEVSAIGALVSNDSGSKDNARSLDTTLIAAIPVMVRVALFSRLIDFEVAPTARLSPSPSAAPPGVRALAGAGIAGSRGASLMPYGLLYLGYEYQPPARGLRADHQIQIGTRLGVDWAP